MGQLIEICVPDIGDFTDVAVIEVLVGPGDSIAAEAPIVVLESDKAAMEVPSTAAGVVREVLVALDDKVSEGSALIRLERSGDTVETGAVGPETPQPVGPVSAPPMDIAVPAPEVATPSSVTPRPGAPAGPSVRRLARELGVDLRRVAGSGPKRRIRKEDVLTFVKSAMGAGAVPGQIRGGGAGGGLSLVPWPKVDFAKYGPVEAKPLSRIRKISGANLARNRVMIPHVTSFEEADISDLEAFRVQLNQENGPSGTKVTMLAFLLKACAKTLQLFPDFNSSLDGEQVILKRYYHLGFAADTPDGLVVPVVRDVDRKGVLEIAVEAAELAGLAREGGLKVEQMQGGTFTISSLGGVGGTGFTPIINAPEVAILGVNRAATRPVWDGGQFVPRLILPLALAWDHRVVDGVAAARFNLQLSRFLSDFRRIAL